MNYVCATHLSLMPAEALKFWGGARSTLGAEIFEVGDFWLETRVIIKIFDPSLADFYGNEAKKIFLDLFLKWPTQKN